MVEIAQVSGNDAAVHHAAIVDVYRATFGSAPYFDTDVEIERFAKRFLHHVEHKGFRGCIAREGGQVVGFAFGFTGEPGGWWREAVAVALSPAMIGKWLDDYFEFAQLAVVPPAQGRGIGGQLHDALLTDVPYRTAALSAYQAETPAMRLYRGRGWVPLVTDFNFPGNTMPFVIMGLTLGSHGTPRKTAGQVTRNNTE